MFLPDLIYLSRNSGPAQSGGPSSPGHVKGLIDNTLRLG
jgi:hypothetical protein